MRQQVSNLVLRAGLFDRVRDLYHLVGNRSYRQFLRRRQEFFSQFVSPGSLVLDVGANRGEFTLMYRRLGARVVSVEPNPALAAMLRARFGAAGVVEAAVSDAPGQATLYLGSDSNYSTIVQEWLPTTRERARLSNDHVDVSVTTVDEIIGRFGVPSFLKIDVEANELKTLRGLHHPVPALMFEYQCPLMHQIAPALDHLLSIGDYEFSLEQDGKVEFTTRDQLLRQVSAVCATGRQSGDIYARLRGQARL